MEYTDEFGNPYEEIHMPDWECDIDGIKYSEWWNIDELNEIADEIESMDESEIHWASAYADENGCDFLDARDRMEDDSTWWEGWSIDEVVRERADEQIACIISDRSAREFVERYFDYDSFADELNLVEADGGVMEVW